MLGPRRAVGTGRTAVGAGRRAARRCGTVGGAGAVGPRLRVVRRAEVPARASTHFDYVNPTAPKGGTLYLRNPDRRTSFDKFNPFTIKGNAPAG